MRARWVTLSRLERVLAARYPFGIVRHRRPVRTAEARKKPSVALLFVAAVSDTHSADDVFAGPQGELLLKAVVQGLNWPRNEIELHFVYSDAEAQKMGADKSRRGQVSNRLKQLMVEARPRAVVALGDEVSALLELPCSPLSLGLDKRTIERGDISFVATADLADVMRSAEIKRSFWTDLKSFSARIKR